MGIKFQGKRVADHLEGTADIILNQAAWTGQPTTKDKIEQPEDKKALEAALMKSQAELTEAMRQFLKNYPDSSLKDQANYYLAFSLQKPDELIQKAVAMSEKSPLQLKAMCQTTLGQVYYKRKQYDQAEKELKKAVEIAGAQRVDTDGRD